MSDARAALLDLLARHGLSPEHPPEVLAEARALAAAPDIDDPALVDLTHLPFATLDDPSAMDLDQALHVEERGDGHLVRYAIADASHYARPGTALWDEALRRGSSYYLPGVMAPMLPRVLSEDVVSLNPDVDRRAVVFLHFLDASGRCTETRVLRARIRSRAKLGFEEAQSFFDGGGPLRGSEGLSRSFEALRVVGERRMQLAEERGVVRFRRGEVKVSLGEGGPAFSALEAIEHPVERYNEQLSLLCNVEGAKLLREEAPEGLVQAVYRAHPPPTEAALVRFERIVEALVRAHGLNASIWAWNRERRPLAEYLDSLPRNGDGGRLASAVHRQALLVGGRATYSADPAVHHGIGAEAYARFSAPMREVVGVFCHDELMEKLAGREHPVPKGAMSDEERREAVIASASRAKELQKRLTREANRMVLDQLFGADEALPAKSRPARRGTLMGLSQGKVHVRLDDPPIDVKVYVRHFEGEAGRKLRVARDEVRLLAGDRAFLTVGDPVAVTVLGRDAEADRWRLACRPT